MTVVVGYIPNQYGEAALSAGLAEARHRGSDVLVVNATKGDALVDQKYLGEHAAAELTKRLESESDVSTEVRQTIAADVASEIVRIAEEVSASLIVIGVRRRSPVGKMFMGSVAQQVLLDATVPVLAVKPD
ncbi:universal stress protein [Aeromicrobium sp.]|uniref:universal stress protein n=1 Tax=Aeromicrobium sp. TaxID=1871063 RepID=UPI002FCC2B79